MSYKRQLSDVFSENLENIFKMFFRLAYCRGWRQKPSKTCWYNL